MDMGTKSEQLRRYIPLIKRVAGKFSRNLPPSLAYEDLVSIGMVGLLDAMSKFDPTKGAKFETYAVIRIRGAILNHLNSMSWIPRSVREKDKALQRAADDFLQSRGRMPDDDELASKMGLSGEAFTKLLEDVVPVSLLSMDEYLACEEDDERTIGDRLVSTDRSPEEIFERNERIETLKATILELPEKERLTVSLYHLEDFNLKEVGEVLRVSESRACQLLSRAVSKLRAALSMREREAVA